MFQCSTRRAVAPYSAFGNRARSPTATTSGRDPPSTQTRIASSVSTPSVRSRPLPASHSTLGRQPRASTTRSAGRSVPSSSWTPVTRPSAPADRAAGSRPSRNVTPCCWCRRASAAPTWAPSGRCIGTCSGATTVTRQPSPIAVAATSHPMNPAPSTTTLVVGLRSARSAAASSKVRTACRPAPATATPAATRSVNRRTRSPVAITKPSQPITVPSTRLTVRSARDDDTAGCPSRQTASSIVLRRRNARVSWDTPAASASLDSGGRL